MKQNLHTHACCVVREYILELNLNEPRMCKWRRKDKESETQRRKLKQQQEEQWTTNEQPLDRLKQSFFTHIQAKVITIVTKHMRWLFNPCSCSYEWI